VLLGMGSLPGGLTLLAESRVAGELARDVEASWGGLLVIAAMPR